MNIFRSVNFFKLVNPSQFDINKNINILESNFNTLKSQLYFINLSGKIL